MINVSFLYVMVKKKDKGKGSHLNGSITDKGIEQAHKSGIFFAKSIKNHANFNMKTDEVIIYSSPYIRCLETSLYIAKS